MNDYWENNYRNMVTENDTLTARIEVLEKAQETALGYATRFLDHFVNEHCSPVPDWKPLPDLLGVLTQIDNSTTVARDYKARIEALEAALRFLIDTKWKSVDKDNMEFEGRVTCYQLDKARKALAQEQDK